MIDASGIQHNPAHPMINPVIGGLANDTLANIHDTLCLLKELIDVRELELTAQASSGLQVVMGCLIKAIDYETQHR